MERLRSVLKRRTQPETVEYALDAESLSVLRENLSKVFEKQFGRYGLNLLLRYWGTKPIRHSVEDRPRTLPFDILADIQHNIGITKGELADGEQTEERTKAALRSLLTRLRELFYDHLIEQGASEHIFYDLSKVHEAVEACLQAFQARLSL